MWRNDLDKFLDTLQKIEYQEELKRLKNEAKNNKNKKKKKPK